MLLFATVHKSRFLRQRRKELVSTNVPQVPEQHWDRIGRSHHKLPCIVDGRTLEGDLATVVRSISRNDCTVQYVFPAPTWL